MQSLKQRLASTESDVGTRSSPEGQYIAREQRIEAPVESILVRLRKLFDKVAEGDVRVARMQRELHNNYSARTSCLRLSLRQLHASTTNPVKKLCMMS